MNDTKLTQLSELCAVRDYRGVVAELGAMHEVDIAEFLEELPLESAAVVFRMLKKDVSADVFANLNPTAQEYIINAISNAEVAFLIEDLYVDDAVDMLEEMPAGVVKRVLKNAEPDTRRLINRFLQYADDSAGSIMTAEYLDLKKDLTVREAIAQVRRSAPEKETVYTCYVTDAKRTLTGAVSFRDLLFADDDASVDEVMEKGVVSCTTGDDKELAASLLSKYNLLAIPVVDGENRLCGIVTYDDAFDVFEDEATEDFQKMAALAPSEKPYLDTSIWSLARHRIVWLLLLMLASVISGLIVGRYELAIGALPLLVSFMPMLTGTGGNAGVQSSTLVIRGLVAGDIEISDWFRVCLKELCVALMCGVTLAAINFARIMIFNGGQTLVALTVSLSLIASVAFAKVLGSMLPLGARLLKLDPAVLAGPLIATVVDSLTLLIYFGIASVLLGI